MTTVSGAQDDNDRDESDELTPHQKKLLEEIVRELPAAMSEAAKRFTTRVLRHGEKILRGRRLKTKGFEERLYTRRAIPLDLYELCLYDVAPENWTA